MTALKRTVKLALACNLATLAILIGFGISSYDAPFLISLSCVLLLICCSYCLVKIKSHSLQQESELNINNTYKAQLELVFSTSPMAMLEVDDTGIITTINNQALKLFNYELEQLQGQNIDTLIPETQRQEHNKKQQAFMAQPEIRLMGAEAKLFGLKSDHSLFPLELKLAPQETPLGQRVTVFISDISEQTRREEDLCLYTQRLDKTYQDLQDMHSRIQMIFDVAPVGMLMVDEKGLISNLNKETLRLFGYEKQQLLNQPIEILIPTADRDLHPSKRQQYTSKPNKRLMGMGRDLHAQRSDGSLFPVEIGLNPLKSESGNMVVASIIDITERAKTKERLARYTSALERSNKELDDFAYIASHDLKSPLRGIKQLSDWIAEDIGTNIDEDVAEHIRLLHVRVNRMEGLLDDLLTYSRVGRTDNEISNVDIRQLILNCFEFVTEQKTSNLEFVGDYFPQMETSHFPLEQIFRNLFNNAIKHSDKEQTTIQVSIEPCETGYSFMVRDNGPGIRPEFHERIFGMFQTLQPRDVVEGSGMGLALIKKIVLTYGGDIKVESDGENGTTFRFTWPDDKTLQRFISEL